MKCFRIGIFCLLAGLFVVTGCSVPVSQKDLNDVEKRYRPDGDKPNLPELRPDSPMSDFITYALLNSPDVESAFYSWKESVKAAASAGSLPSPELILSAEVDKVLTRLIFGLMQEIPAAGTLKLEAEAASKNAQKKRYLFEQEMLKAAYRVEQVYYESILLKEKIRLTTEMKMLVDTQEISSRTKYEIGFSGIEELTMIQSDQKTLGNELLNLEDSARPLMANWCSALGVLPGEEPGVPMPDAVFKENVLPPEKDILTEALANNLNLKSLEAEIEKAQVMIKLAYKKRSPGFKVGLSADTKQHPWVSMPELNASLPIWRRKIRSDIASSKAGEKQARNMLTAEKINLAVMVAEKSFLWREFDRQSRLLKEQLIPLNELALTGLYVNYAGGKTDFASLLDAKRQLADLKIKLIETNIQRETLFAEISLLVASQKPEEAAKILDNH